MPDETHVFQINVTQVKTGYRAACYASKDVHDAPRRDIICCLSDGAGIRCHHHDVVEARRSDFFQCLAVHGFVLPADAGESDSLGLGVSSVDRLHNAQATVTPRCAKDRFRAVGGFDGALDVHPPHRPTSADEPGPPVRLEFGANRHIAVGTSDVRARSANVQPTIVMHPPDVNVDFARERRVSDDGHDTKLGQAWADCLDEVGIGA